MRIELRTDENLWRGEVRSDSGTRVDVTAMGSTPQQVLDVLLDKFWSVDAHEVLG